jgi:hypothetical protein
MKLLRITDHKIYQSLSAHEQLCYKLGLPLKFMNHKVRDLVFMDYNVGQDVTKLVSAPRQQKHARKLKQNMTRHNPDLNGILGCYSSPTDTAAFECAGSIFEACVKAGMSSICIPASRIAHDMYDIPKSDVYLIYGISDLPYPNIDRPLTSFLYERDGSLRIVVMTGSGAKGPWDISQHQLRIKFDMFFVLNDHDERNVGSIEKIG